MDAYRKKPEIGKTNLYPPDPKYEDDPTGCVWPPLAIVLSYFVLSSIVRVTSNSGSKLDQVICYGTLIYLIVIMLLGARNTYLETKAREAEKKRWAQGCKTALLNIVSRREAEAWWDDYDNRFHNLPNSLQLEMNSDQKAVSPNQTIVSVEVSQYVYERLKERNTVCAYYLLESLLTFLLEEELQF